MPKSVQLTTESEYHRTIKLCKAVRAMTEISRTTLEDLLIEMVKEDPNFQSSMAILLTVLRNAMTVASRHIGQ